MIMKYAHKLNAALLCREQKLKAFDNEVLRRIYGNMRREVTPNWVEGGMRCIKRGSTLVTWAW
jgi:hypothetical protein